MVEAAVFDPDPGLVSAEQSIVCILRDDTKEKDAMVEVIEDTLMVSESGDMMLLMQG